MIKCKDCIFEFNSVCENPESDECGMKVFTKYDGCNVGKESTFGITRIQHLALVIKANKRGDKE